MQTFEKFDVVKLFDVDVAYMTMDQVVSVCDQFVSNRKLASIGVVSAAKLINARSDSLLKESLQGSTFVVADGQSVVWLTQLMGKGLPERVAGIDIMARLMELADKKRYRVYFLGARQNILEDLLSYVSKTYPNLVIAGARNGYFSDTDEPEIAAVIKQSGADIIFIGITSPKKEIFLLKWKNELDVSICHGVGGSFDVLAGKVKRAPGLLQRYGLEWLYRVYQEPRRMWKRYLVTNSKFIWRSIKPIFLARVFGVKTNIVELSRPNLESKADETN